MSKALLYATGFLLLSPAPGPAMSYEDALRAIPQRQLPPFWVGELGALESLLTGTAKGAVSELARSPGGRPIYIVALGEREPLPSHANFNSAIGALDPSAYMDKATRRKPVILLVGPVHGHETEGLTGLANLIALIATGQDLRRRDQADLQRLASQCRLLIIPAPNPDGLARFAPRSLWGMSLADLRFWGQGTWRDGTLCGWPACKGVQPMARDRRGAGWPSTRTRATSWVTRLRTGPPICAHSSALS